MEMYVVEQDGEVEMSIVEECEEKIGVVEMCVVEECENEVGVVEMCSRRV